MKNRKLYTCIAYFLLLFSVVLMVAGCRTKKSTLKNKQSDKEHVSIIDKSEEQKKEKVQETAASASWEVFNEKAFSEMWLSFESDKITVTAPDGTKTEIINPKYNKSVSLNTETAKDKHSVADSSKVSETEQKKQSDVKADVDKESTSELKTTDERKTKIVWLYIVSILFSLVIVTVGFFVLKRLFSKILLKI